MFDNNNAQSLAKRDKLRIQIRRRTIDQYKRAVRAEWQSVGTHTQLSQQHIENPPYPKKQQIPQPHILTQPPTLTPSLLDTLQYLSLSPSSQLCTLQTLNILSPLIIPTLYPQIHPHLHRILLKICISQLHWSQDFLAMLVMLLVRVKDAGGDPYEYLLNLAECAHLEFKTFLYGVVHGAGGVIEGIKWVRVMCRFLLVAPSVSHTHHYLCTRNTPNSNPFLYKLLKSLQHIILTSTLTSQKQQSQIIELFYGLCSRFQSRQLCFILTYLSKSDWEMFDAIIHAVVRDAGDAGDAGVDSKIRFKFLQVVHAVLMFCLTEKQFKGMGLEFMYKFLPAITTILIQHWPPISPSISISHSPTSSPCCQHLQNLHQQLSLHTLYILITLQDPQSAQHQASSPALQYLSIVQPDLLQRIYMYYCKHWPTDHKKLKYLVWIFEGLATQVRGIGRLEWACQWVRLCLEGGLKGDCGLLFGVVEAVGVIVEGDEEEEREGLERGLGILEVIADAKVRGKLEEIYYGEGTNKELRDAIESILSISAKNIQ